MKAIDIIKARQLEWAKRKGLVLNEKEGYLYYCKNIECNVYGGLFEDVREQFKQGDGNELEDKLKYGKIEPAKMKSLFSSSALCVNAFQYLTYNNLLESVAQVFEFEVKNPDGIFEKPFKINGNRYPANIDFVINGKKSLVAIESKFTEPYGKVKKEARLLKQSYLNKNDFFKCNGMFDQFPKLKKWIDSDWKEDSYSNNLKGRLCPYERLDAAQLIKHLLGLSKQTKEYELCYLYYCIDSDEMNEHGKEVENFKSHLDDCIKFEAMSYQDFFRKLKLKGQEHKEFLEYMKDRYNLE